MNPTSLDHVTSALISLQRAQEAHHQAVLTGFASLRDKIDEVRLDTLARIDHSAAVLTERFERGLDRQDKRIEQVNIRVEQLSNRIEQVNGRIDRLVFWMAGLMVTNLLAVTGFILRTAGAI